MHLRALSVSKPKTAFYNGEAFQTGIFKTPISHRAQVSPTQIEGDGQADMINHGGIDKAIYAYPFEHYAYWQEQLGRDDLSYGQFGENLTIEGAPLEDELQIGDRLRIGEIVVEVSQPRIPCFKLGVRMEMPAMVKRFAQSRRSGYYLRVIETGTIGAGDAIEFVERMTHGVTIHTVFSAVMYKEGETEILKRALDVNLPEWVHERIEDLIDSR